MNLNKNKLLEYGFSLIDGYYRYTERYDDLEIRIKLKDEFEVEVYDLASDDIFLPFSQSVYGAYVGGLKERVDDLKKDIIEKCRDVSVMDELEQYAYKKYGVKRSYPFGGDETFAFRKLDNNKMFLLRMVINKRKLGLNSEEMCEVINLRLKKERVTEIIDTVHYFYAYHMNKTYWVSVLVDESSDLDALKALLNESYECVK